MVKIRKWIPLFTTQFLGVVNDNVLKHAIIFISIFWLLEDDRKLVTPIASALLVLPFVLFSPLAGRWSQTKSKQRIFEIAKLIEIPIMVVAIFGFFIESINVVMIAMLMMGVQSALYSPSKYGLIRDIGGVEGVSFGIGTMELLTFVSVLIGQVLTGLIADLPNNNVLIISLVMFALALTGWISSRKISAVEPKPVKNFKDTINPFKYLYESYNWSKSVKGLNYTIFGLGSFWLVAAMLQMNILEHAPQYYGMSITQTSFVIAIIAIGIGLGCWVAGLIAKDRVEIGLVPIGGIALSICLTIFATVEMSSTKFTILLFIAAFFGGLYKVPLNAWLQQRVEGRKLGNILAYNNIVVFLCILIASAIYAFVITYFDTITVFIFIAVISWIMTIITLVNIPAMMVRFIADAIAKLYFKFDLRGAVHIPQKSGGLLIANHQSMIDPLIIVAAVPRMVRFVMAREIYENPFIHWLVKRMNVIPVTTNIGIGRLEEFTRICQEEINQGHLVCIFPEGQISRIGHLLEFKKGVEHIAEGINAPIIPLHIAGIKGTPFSFDVGSSRPIVSFRSFRKPISVSIGKPIYNQQSAFHLR
ncbi:MAG: MFS transporter, partial [Cyclobacteriaceae bacterium]|nr:MFS transporter [Cyclobacteriaceae bacterium]